MELDGEEPPDLVDLESTEPSTAPANVASAQLQDLTLTKVPITIVTGWNIGSFIIECEQNH